MRPGIAVALKMVTCCHRVDVTHSGNTQLSDDADDKTVFYTDQSNHCGTCGLVQLESCWIRAQISVCEGSSHDFVHD